MKAPSDTKTLIPDWLVGILILMATVSVAAAGGFIYCFYAAATALLSLIS